MQLRSRGQAISAITPTNLLMKINHLSDDTVASIIRLPQSSANNFSTKFRVDNSRRVVLALETSINAKETRKRAS